MCQLQANCSAVLRIHFIKPTETSVVSWIFPDWTIAGAALTLPSFFLKERPSFFLEVPLPYHQFTWCELWQQATWSILAPIVGPRPSRAVGPTDASWSARQPYDRYGQSVTGRLRAKSDPIGGYAIAPPGHLSAGLSLEQCADDVTVLL